MNFDTSDSEYGASSDELNGALGDPEPDPLEDGNDYLAFEIPTRKSNLSGSTSHVSLPAPRSQRNRPHQREVREVLVIRGSQSERSPERIKIKRRNSSQGTVSIASPSPPTMSAISDSSEKRVANEKVPRYKRNRRDPLTKARKTNTHDRNVLLLRDRPSEQDVNHDSLESQSDEDDPVRLRRKLRRLQVELEAAQANVKPHVPQAVPAYRSGIIHCIRDHNDASRYYLEEPQWVHGEGFKPELDGRSPIRNLDFYLQQHPELAFVFYKEYDDRPPRDLSKIETTDGVLRRAEPFHESLDLVAEHMIEAVEHFVSYVPDFDRLFPDFDTSRPIHAPYLFAYHSAVYLDDICSKLEPLHAVWIKTLMRDISAEYGEQHAKAEIKAKQGLVTKELMPYLVKPGDILVKLDGLHTRAYQATSWLGGCKSTDYVKTEEHQILGWDDPRGPRRQTRNQENITKKILHQFKVDMWSFSFDGVFQRTTAEDADSTIDLVAVYEDDEIKIDRLNLFPLQYASKETRELLARRGDMLWKCRHRRLVTHHHESDNHLSNVTDRYMVDMVNCRKLFPKLFPQNRLRDDIGKTAMSQDEPPEHINTLLFPPTIAGYNLRAKKCRTLYMDCIKDVKWNKLAFDHLVIEHQAKELVQALVMNQLEAEQTTDPISGKGGGLILLLHGGPGTGKTFTAEGVAEFAEKPLLRVTCGDVGIEARQVEKYLQRCFRLGKIWDCVVLLDEADVFLEERDVKDLNRNALVSVFLRMLEYYQGILILTSNRVGTFDEAFKSRIQLALHYEKLNEPQRRKVWRNFVDRLNKMENANIDFNDVIDNIEELGRADMNGREIRNVITTARQLAKWKSEKLAFMHLKHAIEVGERFTKYLNNLNEGETFDQMKLAAGIR